MSDLLGIGASGVSAYRSALSVIGDNIVNAETPGYARRSIVLRESGISAGSDPIYRDRVNFGGVDPVSVRRAWDDFKAADSRLAGATAGRADTRMRWLGVVEAGLDDGATGVGQTVTGVFTGAETLASDPSNGFGRRAFLTAIDAAAGAFRTSAQALERTAGGIADEAGTTVDAVNADVAALARLNVALRRAGVGTSAHAQLTDERDRLLDDLSDKIDIDVATAPDGTVAISLARATGAVLVDNSGLDPGVLSVARGGDDRLALGLFSHGDMIAVHATGGALAGLVEVAGTVANRRAQLGALAGDFATRLNDWSANGVDANGDPGTALLAFDPADPAGTIATAVADRDPATVAAASADGTENGNLLALGALRGAAGTERQWAGLVAGQAQMLSSARSENATAGARKDAAFAARDAIAGIDLDYEAAELLRFQQAYSGSAKIIQVARETLQTILDAL